MGGTFIAHCTCLSDFQDKTYGKGQRVHNVKGGKNTAGGVRGCCTVCSSEHVKTGK